MQNADTPDPFDLQRFVEAQEGTYKRALSEIRSGLKQSHWMWFIFPQFEGLGMSHMSRLYAVRSLAEARAYLAHPVLGPRLVECATALQRIDDLTANDILGFPDDIKLRSCATLFARVSAKDSVFHRLIDKYFEGEHDDATISLIAKTDTGT